MECLSRLALSETSAAQVHLLLTGALAEFLGLEDLGSAIIELADLVLCVRAPILLMLQRWLVVVEIPAMSAHSSSPLIQCA